MRTYEVELLAFGGGKIRLVDVPEPAPAEREDLLEAIFRYGQNDFQPRPICSVSVGDVVRLPDGTRWRVAKCGFEPAEN